MKASAWIKLIAASLCGLALVWVWRTPKHLPENPGERAHREFVRSLTEPPRAGESMEEASNRRHRQWVTNGGKAYFERMQADFQRTNVWKHYFASEFDPAERSALTNLFQTQFKPALASWSKIYAGHLPFDPDQVTPGQCVSRDQGRNFTFMIGDTTLVMARTEDSPFLVGAQMPPGYEAEAHVFYLATKQGMQALNSIPSTGAAPDLSMPLTREDVKSMLLADGADLQRNQLTVFPSGTSGSLAGGMVVNVGQPNDGTGQPVTLGDFHLVFGPDGKLVTYCK